MVILMERGGLSEALAPVGAASCSVVNALVSRRVVL